MPRGTPISKSSEQHQHKNDKEKKADTAIQPVPKPVSGASTDTAETAQQENDENDE
jgi:hypothetical protein